MFKFKQFSIEQDKSAMKVGTDGVLLGAWVDALRKRVLDIGTGTGLIALMYAQRNLEAFINAIDIDLGAVEQAEDNRLMSPWQDRVSVKKCNAVDVDDQYDLIISNPPFFNDTYHPFDDQRDIARHEADLTFDTLMDVLEKTGSKALAAIYPANRWDDLMLRIEKSTHAIKRMCWVHPTPQKPARRIMFELEKDFEGKIREERIVIEDGGRHHYSKEYKELTKDFYL